METKEKKKEKSLKEGRYYIQFSAKRLRYEIYYIQYIGLFGVPCGWRFSYEKHPVRDYHGWVTFKSPHFGYDGDQIDTTYLKLIPKKLEDGITCFDTATPPHKIIELLSLPPQEGGQK